MKSVAQPKQPIPAFTPKAPDGIMAELWRTKQRINAEAGYDIDKLLARVKRQSKQVASSVVKVNHRSNRVGKAVA